MGPNATAVVGAMGHMQTWLDGIERLDQISLEASTLHPVQTTRKIPNQMTAYFTGTVERICTLMVQYEIEEQTENQMRMEKLLFLMPQLLLAAPKSIKKIIAGRNALLRHLSQRAPRFIRGEWTELIAEA